MPEAIDFLTGAPSTSYSISDPSGINNNAITAWTIIDTADKAKFIITAASDAAGGSDKSVNEYGLALSHAYTVAGAHLIKNPSTGAIVARLIEMRNPWGSDGAYSGVWKDGSAIITTY